MTLITPIELAGLLSGDQPPSVLDATFYLTEPERGRAEYLAGHVPGAVFVSVDDDLSAPRADGIGGRHPLPPAEVFATAMRRAGVGSGRPVVVYDQKTPLSAARLWWMLVDAGHDDVRVLDGGMAAWTAAGMPVEPGEHEVAPGDFEAALGRLPLVGADDIPGLLAAGAQLWDVRAAERYRGDTEPIDRLAGHIPGARNLPATTLQRADGAFLSGDELAAACQEVAPGDIVSCGSGITACQALLACDAAGTRGVRLYAGSWSDWISDPSRPIATGDRPGG